MTPTITPATAKDLQDLVAMIAQLCAFHGDTSQMGLARAQSELIGNDSLHCLIAREAEAAVGYVVIEAHWRPMNATNGLDIAHLFVKERSRGYGIGTALVDAARNFAIHTNAAMLTIGTAPNNPGAANSYRRMGLQEQTGPHGARFRVPL